MLPVVALVGRPNVGKSTLFNALLGRREALVHDRPGVTRDRHHAVLRLPDGSLILVDTGGLGGSDDPLAPAVERQVERAIAEADLVLLVLDARTGPVPEDVEILRRLRRSGKTLWAVVNKAERLDPGGLRADFAELGLGSPWLVAAAHGHGVAELRDALAEHFGDRLRAGVEEAATGARIAIVGRPNAGKSTLLNRLLGEERVLVSDIPGTTRDAIAVPLRRDDRAYVLIDTAGIRRRARVVEAVEKVSVIKSLQAIEACDVAIVVCDAAAGIAEQDLTIVGQVLDAGRALVIAVNKWDGLEPAARERCRGELERRLRFVRFARRVFISALHGSGLGELWQAIDRAFDSATRALPTAELNRILEDAYAAFQPPMVGGRTAKLRYAHQGGRRPPCIVVHGTRVSTLAAGYRRYLENVFRERLGLEGTPIRLEFVEGRNPSGSGGGRRRAESRRG